MSEELQQRLEEASSDCLDKIEAAHNSDDSLDSLKGEISAIKDFTSEVTGLVADGLSRHKVNPYYDTIADKSEAHTKTDLKEAVDEQANKTKQCDSGRQPLDEFIERRLSNVTVVRTTDKKADPLWRWHFGSFEIETGSTKNGIEHFNWGQFRDEIYRASGELPGKPDQALKDGGEWKEWIRKMIKKRGHEKRTRGPRTVAVDALQDFVSQADAYGQLSDAVEHNVVRVDDDPDEGDPDEIWIPNHHIKRICDDTEITPRAFQVELDARGYLVPRLSGASEQQRIQLNGNNNHITYWVLDADFADPASYQEEASSPAELRNSSEVPALANGDDEESVGVIGKVSGSEGGGADD